MKRKKIVKYFLSCFLLICSLVNYSGYCSAGNNRADTLDLGVNQLINNYLELFSITDQNGVYHQYFEARFKSLFTEDALILNFLQGTTRYNQLITLDDYIKIALEESENKIIRPGVSGFTISQRLRSDNPGFYTYKVSLNKIIHTYSKLNYENLYNSEIELEIELIADEKNHKFWIKSIKPRLPRVVHLDYNVYYTDRRPAQNQLLYFSYFDEESGKEITRPRYTNHQGLISISNLPEHAEVKIGTDENIEVLLNVTKTARQWDMLSEKDRFIILSPREPLQERIIKPYKLRFGSKYHFPILYAIIANYRHFAFENPVIEMIPDFDFYFIISRSFIMRPDYALAFGYGIEYHSMVIDVQTRDLVYFNQQSMGPTIFQDPDFKTGRVISEQYTWNSLRFPFLLTWIYHSNNRLFESFDLSLVFRYHISPRVDYSFIVEEVSISDWDNYEAPDNMINNSTGNFLQNSPFSVAAEMAFNFNLYKDVFILQYSIAYGLSDLGNRRRLYFHADYPSGFSEFYQPMFKNNKLRYYNLSVGLGLAIKF